MAPEVNSFAWSDRRSKKQSTVTNGISRWSSRQSTPAKLHELCSVGTDDLKRSDYCSYLQQECCIRLAQSAAHLQSLPHGWADQQPFRQIIDLHDFCIRGLETCPAPRNAVQEDRLTDKLNEIYDELQRVASTSTVLHRLKELSCKLDSQCHMPQDVQKMFLNFFTLRNSIGIFIQLHNESRQSPKAAFSKILQPDCSPFKVAEAAARGSAHMCRDALGQSPRVVMQGDSDATVPYVPAVLQYMLTEILKNACRAVVERHGRWTEDTVLPPVFCKIENRSDGMIIRIIDEGCGMSTQQVEKVWNFLYTTYERSAWLDGKAGNNKQQSGILAGHGVGLPLSRMYARYFGGDLMVTSTEGRGTEVSIHLSRSAHCAEVLPPSLMLDLPMLDSSVNWPGTISAGPDDKRTADVLPGESYANLKPDPDIPYRFVWDLAALQW